MILENYLQALRLQLSALPAAERERWIEDYREMLYDRIEDGLSEEDAVAELGQPEEIAKQILAEVPLSMLIKERVRPKRKLRVWEIVLLILGAPLWLPLLIAAAVVLLSLLITALAIVAGLIAVAAAAVINGGVVLFEWEGSLLVLAGISLVMVGLGLLLGVAAWKLGKGLVQGITKLFRRCFLQRRSTTSDKFKQEVEG